MKDKDSFNDGLLAFIQGSPTPFHAVEQLTAVLLENGYKELSEASSWNIQNGGRYFVTRNDSSLIAFTAGDTPLKDVGWRMLGAHTDSPCLKLKPNPLYKQNGYWQLGVEVYGGVLLNPWFDRDLSLAGRVSFETDSGGMASALIDFARPIAAVPSLAIHLDREVNSNRSVNPQTQLNPILKLVSGDEHWVFDELLLNQLQSQHPDSKAIKILNFELCCYDYQAPAIIGLKNEFIAAARLDNLLSCYTGLQSLLEAEPTQHCILVCNDHEEVGSQSAIGAQGPMLNGVLQRLVPDVHEREQALARSMMISADNAHGIHPNFADKHDKQHGPMLNAGPVIKVNANQRYATNSESAAVFRQACDKAKVPVQVFASRADMACGSTIGPLTAANIGVTTLDVGAPTFAMHSIRELAGADDGWHLYRALSQFLALDQVHF